MYKRELYMELRENRDYMIVVDRNDVLKTLAKLGIGAIIERGDLNYHIYYSKDNLKENNSIEDEQYCLRIEPAARIRYEGGLDEYEKLLEEINNECDGGNIYGILREGNVKRDFLVIDIFYKMKVEYKENILIK